MGSDYLRRLEALEAEQGLLVERGLIIVEQREGEDPDAALTRTCAEMGVPRYVNYPRLLIIA